MPHTPPREIPANRPAPLRIKLLLVLLGTLCALTAGEIAVRILSPCAVYGAREEAPQKAIYQYDARLGWRGRPNATGHFAGYDFAVRVHLDSHGYRTPSPPATAGKRNLVLIGDSVAWGWGVEDEQTAAAVLQRRHPEWNLYNLAAPGYGTDQQYLALQEFCALPKPAPIDRFLLLLYTANDFDDVGATSRYSFPKPRFRLRNGALQLTNVPVPEDRAAWYDQAREAQPAPHRTLLEHSQLYNITWGRYRARRRQAAAATLRQLHNRVDPHTRERRAAENEALVRQLILAMRDEAARAGADFAVLLLHAGDPDDRLARTSAFLADQQIPHDTFLQHAPHLRSGNLCFDPHPNALGQERLARAAERLLAAQSR